MDYSTCRDNWLVIWINITPISALILYKNKIANGPNIQTLKMQLWSSENISEI